MTKTTFRDSDEAVKCIEILEEEGHFDSKSDFYRFVRDYTLDQMFEDYENEYPGLEEKLEELESLEEGALAVAYAQEKFQPEFDYAVTMRDILREDRDSEEKIDEALELTEKFLGDNFSSSYYVERSQ